MRYLIVSLMLLAAAPVQAESASGSGDGAKLVCFNQPATGSHIKKRVCMTEKELAERRKQDQDAVTRLKGGPSAERQRAAGGLR